MDELYHFYNFASPYRIFRVTHYGNYCSEARNALGYPICVEYWPHEETEAQCIAGALKELREMGIIDLTAELRFQAMYWAPNHHRLFELKAVESIETIREKINELELKNLVTIGVLAEKGELLLYEILRSAYGRLS